jgi:hypothetical protein
MAKKEKKPDGNKITVIISDNLDKRYDVVKKSYLPANIVFKGKKVNWVTNFGFKPKPGISVAQSKIDNQGLMKGALEEAYTIRLAKAGEDLVYYDGSDAQGLAYTPSNAKMGDMVEAALQAGDPPIGWC